MPWSISDLTEQYPSSTVLNSRRNIIPSGPVSDFTSIHDQTLCVLSCPASYLSKHYASYRVLYPIWPNIMRPILSCIRFDGVISTCILRNMCPVLSYIRFYGAIGVLSCPVSDYTEQYASCPVLYPIILSMCPVLSCIRFDGAICVLSCPVSDCFEQ